MEWCKVVFVMIIVRQLDSFQNENDDISDEIMTEDGFQTWCPLSNFTVTHIFSHDYPVYINLKLSWNKIETEDAVDVLIRGKLDFNKNKNCLSEMDVFDHSLINNSILEPNMTTEDEIYPGCKYDITFLSRGEGTIYCNYTYTVPECEHCDTFINCEQFEPLPEILSVEPIAGNNFLVKWNSVEASINSALDIKQISFEYTESNKALKNGTRQAKLIRNDMQEDTSEIIMDLLDGKNYTLTGTLEYNFSCLSKKKFDFVAPRRANYIVTIIILTIVVLIIILLAWKYKKLVKYEDKFLKLLVPNTRSYQHSQELVCVAEKIPMEINLQYHSVGFLEEPSDEYEFPRNRIIIKELIGSGDFGQVYSAKAIGIGGTEGYRMVAVKTLGYGDNVTTEAKNDFLAEIDIFKKISQHSNIVALFGCCTMNTPYMMIMEFVPCGDLKKYLIELRHQWLKKKDCLKQTIFLSNNANIGGYMDWFKVIFVMVVVNRLDSIQDENNSADELSGTIDSLEKTFSLPAPSECSALAKACRTGNDLILNLKSLIPTTTTKIETIEKDYCYQFTKINDSFILHVNETHFKELNDCEYHLLSKLDEPLYYINGTSLSQIRAECPDEENFCLEPPMDVSTNEASDEIEAECPLSNFSVSAVLSSQHDYINLQLSWDKPDEDEAVTIRIHQKVEGKKNCFEETMITNHSLLDNKILKPNAFTERDVNPGCAYDIHVTSEHSEREKFKCDYTYIVPDCVEDKCDCDKFNTKPKILKIEAISDNKFVVKWDSEKGTTNGKPFFYNDVHFKYHQSNKLEEEPTNETKNNLNTHTSEIKMELLEGKEYALIGTFKNNFSCSAEDRHYFIAPTSTNYIVLILIVVLIVLVIIFSALQYKNIAKYKRKFLNFVSPDRMRRNQPLQELVSIQTGQVPMNSNFHYTPVEFLEGVFDEYEFPRNKIIIKEVIGSGAFGQVYSAKAIGIGGIEGHRMVAVKTLGEGENISKEAANDFIAEIEIFKKIGHHPNIVAFLGCCTVDAPYMMIMEFVPCGDLKNYLVDLRTQWLKMKNIAPKKKQFFFPDDSDGAYIEPTSPITPVSITSSRLPSTSETVSTTLEDQITPLLGPYSLDKLLDHTELQTFAFQIAKGMAHLEKIGVTHRDLAARNILINEYKTLKISDFGLSRTGPYINHRTKKLPLRWMAIEAITEQKYDSKSDVWSFGVVLWEIGTLGAFPYESVPDSFIQQFLQLGRRLERPEICTDELYSLMKECWATDPEKRPNFQELVDALDVKKRKIYVNFNQLNPTYVFPPSDIEKCVENPVQLIDINMNED